jgi:two-component system sensor histidine kinase KdpD
MRGPLDRVAAPHFIVSMIVPLTVESRRLGLMYIRRHGEPRELDAPARRFLAAIGYYAALGAERLRLARETERANALREESRAKDEVLATVSHDLRTPLTTIKLLAQLATARGEASGKPIEAEVDRLADLVTNVLDLSRIRAGGVRLDVELNTAEDLVGAAIRRAAGIAQGRSIVPHLDFDAPALTGRFDFVQSLRIVGNLIDNAIRYTRPGGEVEVYAAHEGPWLAIRVADRGPGIPAAERERIFEPFYRPKSESPDVGHAGLGLSIARRLAELQGGRLSYETRFGGGSVFTLLLPAVEATGPALVVESRALESV